MILDRYPITLILRRIPGLAVVVAGAVFFIVLLIMMFGRQESEFSHVDPIEGHSEVEEDHTENEPSDHSRPAGLLSGDDRELMEKIAAVGRAMEIPHHYIEEAQGIVDQPRKEKAVLRQLFNEQPPMKAKRCGDDWRIWSDFGHEGIYKGTYYEDSPAREFAEEMANSLCY